LPRAAWYPVQPLAMVGEGGEPEYIVPQSKASGFAANWMAGQRGAAAIPGFAKGGDRDASRMLCHALQKVAWWCQAMLRSAFRQALSLR
jgi:hypothetical protein